MEETAGEGVENRVSFFFFVPLTLQHIGSSLRRSQLFLCNRQHLNHLFRTFIRARVALEVTEAFTSIFPPPCPRATVAASRASFN